MADKSCFVVSPIGDPGSPIRRRADNLVDHILRPVLEPMGFKVDRADRLDQPGSITSKMIEAVINSELVVADLTGRNANVYYELALRHAVQKPYVQMIDDKEINLPFDIKDEATIPFDIADLGSVHECKAKLKAYVAAATAEGFKVITPIGKALQLQAAMNEGGPSALILERLERLERAITGTLRSRLPSPTERSLREYLFQKIEDLDGQIQSLDQREKAGALPSDPARLAVLLSEKAEYMSRLAALGGLDITGSKEGDAEFLRTMHEVIQSWKDNPNAPSSHSSQDEEDGL